VIDCADHGAVVDFWIAALGDYTRHATNEQYVAIVPAQETAGRPLILFQKVPEPKVVKNRMHLDLRGESMAAEVARLTALGARVVAGRSLGESLRWTVMEDPEGNEFCVTGG
jgi:predicted enzyme related to lactoylglutathione lyase